jgi:hypothetical protein
VENRFQLGLALGSQGLGARPATGEIVKPGFTIRPVGS